MDCNPYALKLFGCRREQIIGQSPIKFSPARQPGRAEFSRESAGENPGGARRRAAAIWMAALRETEKPAHELLSNRESQVMLKIAQGKSLKEIAAELSLSAKTVGTYHIRILRKMGLKNDIELTRYVLLNKLVE
jgi:DNA-binding NarL/FixJ family response regulator